MVNGKKLVNHEDINGKNAIFAPYLLTKQTTNNKINYKMKKLLRTLGGGNC